jgi:transcriptional regulator with XRE-family HTH domain
MEEEMENICLEFGLKIRTIRVKKNISQEQLAFNAGLHRAYIGQIERGEKNIGLVNIKKIADALGLKLSELFIDL